MAIDEVGHIFRRTRTREAIRDIRKIPTDDITKKMLLAEFFQEHRRAAPGRGAKRAAYDSLLGRRRNRRLG